MRKIFHTWLITFFVLSLFVWIYHYKELLYSNNTDSNEVNNQELIDTSGNSQDFYAKNIEKITPIISQQKDEPIINEDFQEIILEENKLVNIPIPENKKYKQKIEITFLWDVMIGSRVWEAIDEKWQDYVYGWLTEYLSQKDWVVLNLETTVTTREEKINKSYTFKAKPEYLSWLKWFNKNLYTNLANNHIWDFTASGVLDTMNYLDEYDIKYFWAWKNKSQADSVKIMEIEWVKLWLIWQTCVNPVSFAAWENLAGNSRFDKEIILQEIQSAKNQNVDIIVYNMHCGKEYSNGPNATQTDFARFAIDSWANLVIWHHPHRYQPIEIYNDSFIFYSLWDTIFDIFRGRRTQEGIMANIIIENKKIIAAEIIPTYTQSYGNTVISNEAMAKYVLNELYNISKKIWDIPEIKEWKIFLAK